MKRNLLLALIFVFALSVNALALETGELKVKGALTVGATGVKMTGSNGSLTLLGVGDGQDEDIKLDFNTTANTLLVTSPASSLDKIDIGAISLRTTSRIKDMPHKWSIPVAQPYLMYTAGSTIIPVGTTDAAITITKIVCNTSSASYEVAGDLKWADARIGLGGATLINDFDTTSGTRTDTSITAGSVAADKFIYLSLDSAPSSSMTDFTLEIYWDYD